MKPGVHLSCLLACSILAAPQAFAGAPPSRFGVDAPELAGLGRYAVGVRKLSLVQADQVDVLGFDPAKGSAPKSDRALTVDIWYPARVARTAKPEVYTDTLPSEPPAPPTKFSVPGIAVRDAPAAGTGYPLVVVSHGYSNSTFAMTWLTENLASKGYVVAAIRHADPPITDRAKLPQLLMRRPLDIAFVTRTLRSVLGSEHLVDPGRIALIGYSMGGYGVLAATGATLDPAGAVVKRVPGGLMLPYARGGAMSSAMIVRGIRATVAMAPVGGGALDAWGSDGLKSIHAPLLLISGDADRTVDYATGARAFFNEATAAERFLLTFRGCGHAIGLSAVPDSMRGRLWDEDWFEDPVWRKERINAISMHFITAFLDRYVKDDFSRQTYLEVRTPSSDDGAWPASDARSYDAFSPSTGPVTVWKGFQRNHSTGLELLHGVGLMQAN